MLGLTDSKRSFGGAFPRRGCDGRLVAGTLSDWVAESFQSDQGLAGQGF